MAPLRPTETNDTRTQIEAFLDHGIGHVVRGSDYVSNALTNTDIGKLVSTTLNNAI